MIIPALSTRNWFGKNPLRIVVDLNGELPINLKLFNDELPTLVFTLKSKSDTEFVTYIKLNNNKHWLNEFFSILYERNIQSILVEGGPKTLQLFIDKNIWNEAHVFTSNKVWGDGIIAPQLTNFKEIHSQAIFDDQYNIFIPTHK